jgi:hypothetical protein
MTDYLDFLATKKQTCPDVGFDYDPPDFLYPFQKDCVKWACQKGRSALFEDCGLGKTPQQLVWADSVLEYTGDDVLILAPLAVSRQTQLEGVKFGIDVNLCRAQEDVKPGINITNYEMLQHFDASKFGGLVLDESSILKNYSGSYRKMITGFTKSIKYRLACTATPAPNDLIEITTHSEFLNFMDRKEAIALFFIQDGNSSNKFKLKGHARTDFWKWMASWSRAIRTPADMGYEDSHFNLPKLHIHEHIVDGHITDGFLFPIEAKTQGERQQARRESIKERVGICADMVNNTDEPFLIWCGLNAESEMLKKSIPDAIEVQGKDSIEHKEDAMIGFKDGKYRVLITKPKISGFGMNWQHCQNMAFVGLSDSWEAYYQAVRRCWRFGQTKPVHAHLIIANTEGAVKANIERKEANATNMMNELVSHMRTHYEHRKDDSRYDGKQEMTIPKWMKG